jgi:putative protease
MNVTNSYALAALLEMGYEGAVLSDEISAQGEKELLAAFESRYGAKAPVLKTVYEKPRLMLMKHCPVNTVLKDGTRKNCSLCRTSTFELLGKDGKKAFLYGTPECRMQIFDETAVDEIDRIGELKEEGFEAFHMVFTDESKEQTEAVLARFADQLPNKAENDPKINTDTDL